MAHKYLEILGVLAEGLCAAQSSGVTSSETSHVFSMRARKLHNR